MPEPIRVAAVNEIPPGEGRQFETANEPIAVFNVGGEFHAIGGTCPHAGGPLGEGTLNGTCLTCPWHAWNYDVTTGKCLTVPTRSVPKYEVKVEAGEVIVFV